jgi:hypothetical protein
MLEYRSPVSRIVNSRKFCCTGHVRRPGKYNKNSVDKPLKTLPPLKSENKAGKPEAAETMRIRDEWNRLRIVSRRYL